MKLKLNTYKFNIHNGTIIHKKIGNWTANSSTLSALEAGMVAYWKAEDLTDSKGSHTLTNNNSVTFTSGKHNNAFTLNGSSQYLKADASSDWDMGTGDWTVGIWVKWGSVVNDTGLIGMSATDSQFNLSYHAGYLRNGTMSLSWLYTPTVGSYVNIVWSRIGNTASCYVNGTKLASDRDVTGISFGRSDTFLQLGYTYQFGNLFNGQIDEVLINKGHGATQAEVTALYNGGTGAFYTP